MPFGPYKDFKDCVAKNSDKENPAAYCAVVHKKITGKYPSENQEELAASLVASTLSEAEHEAMLQSAYQDILTHYFADEPSRKLTGVEVFRVGNHTDSLGRTRVWTLSDLRHVVSNFKQGFPPLVPLKLGHTSEEYNQQVSKALGIPSLVLSGEGPGGTGAAALGKVTDLRLSPDGVLTADLSVPGKVADLIKTGTFTGVSAELASNYKGHGLALSALALLGAQRPALSSLKPLQAAAMLSEAEPTYTYFTEFRPESITEETTTKKPAITKEADASPSTSSRPGGHAAANSIPPFEGPSSHHPTATRPDIPYPDISDLLYHAREPGPAQFSDTLYEFQNTAVFEVPVTEERLDENGRVLDRTVTVKHVRASAAQEARGVVLRSLEQTLSSFGTIVGRGLGVITVALASGLLARYRVGDPELLEQMINPAGAALRAEQERTRRRIIDIMGRMKGFERAFHLSESRKAGTRTLGKDLATSSNATQTFAGSSLAAMIRSPAIILGYYLAGRALYRLIASHPPTGRRRTVFVWADTPGEATAMTGTAFPPSQGWTLDYLGKAIAGGLDALHAAAGPDALPADVLVSYTENADHRSLASLSDQLMSFQHTYPPRRRRKRGITIPNLGVLVGIAATPWGKVGKGVARGLRPVRRGLWRATRYLARRRFRHQEPEAGTLTSIADAIHDFVSPTINSVRPVPYGGRRRRRPGPIDRLRASPPQHLHRLQLAILRRILKHPRIARRAARHRRIRRWMIRTSTMEREP